MALYTDGAIASLDDLRRYDSTVLDVAGNEGIDLDAKLEIGQREIGLEITSFLLRNGVELGPRRELTKVLVTEPILHAHAVHTLELVYRDAYNSQLNDRYGGKWKEYRDLSKHACSLLFQIGVGVTETPVARAIFPGARYLAGGSNGELTYWLGISWMGANGDCGAMSEVVMTSVPAGHSPTVAIANLPERIAGWHLWAGLSPAQITRQTELPLGPGSQWTLPPQGLRTELPDIPEQIPNRYVVATGQLGRG